MTPIGQKNWHLLNHHRAGVPFPAIKNIAQKYHDEFYCYEDYEPIGINDRALPHGGVFDTNQLEGGRVTHTTEGKRSTSGTSLAVRTASSILRIIGYLTDP